MLKDLVRGLGGELGDKTDAAGVKIEPGIDEASIYIGGRAGGVAIFGGAFQWVEVWMDGLPSGEAHSQLYDPQIWNVAAEAAEVAKTSKEWGEIRRRAVALGADEVEFELEVEERACDLADSACRM